MDRAIFNETDRAFQEGKQNILNNKEEELSYEYAARLEEANRSYVTRLKVISQSQYSYSDRKEKDDQEHQRFETIKTDLEQERQDRIKEETAKDIERLNFLYFPEMGRDATLEKIKGLEKAAEMNMSETFNERSGEKNVKGYLKEQYDEKSGFVAEEKEEVDLTDEFEISAADKNDAIEIEDNPSLSEDYSYSENEIGVEIDFTDHGYEPSNDNSPSEGFEP